MDITAGITTMGKVGEEAATHTYTEEEGIIQCYQLLDVLLIQKGQLIIINNKD